MPNEIDGDYWKHIAVRLARAIVRYDKNDSSYATVSQSAILSAYKVLRETHAVHILR
jgi:hypothetical protein